MITTTEAFDILLDSGITKQVKSLPLSSCNGKILAQDIVCDHDLPPFDRVMMDGYAFHFSGLNEYGAFELIGEQRAGFPPLSIQSPKHCIEVMTGCVLPAGCDTVVAVEQSIRNGTFIHFKQSDIRIGQHIHRKSQDHICGEVLVSAGARVHAGIIAIAASCGLSELKVYAIGSATILSTGDELVDVHVKPQAWQIRKSNPYLLRTVLNSLGISNSIEHCLDDELDLRRKMEGADESDLVVLSGGVSMGKFDLVPSVLKSMKYEILFHKVLQKPGKPLLAAMRNNQWVLAFPGNPVSVMACVCRYLLPLLDERYSELYVSMENINQRPSTLNLLLPVKVHSRLDGSIIAESVRWNGSGDIASLSMATGFVEIESSWKYAPERLRYFPIP